VELFELPEHDPQRGAACRPACCAMKSACSSSPAAWQMRMADGAGRRGTRVAPGGSPAPSQLSLPLSPTLLPSLKSPCAPGPLSLSLPSLPYPPAVPQVSLCAWFPSPSPLPLPTVPVLGPTFPSSFLLSLSLQPLSPPSPRPPSPAPLPRPLPSPAPTGQPLVYHWRSPHPRSLCRSLLLPLLSWAPSRGPAWPPSPAALEVAVPVADEVVVSGAGGSAGAGAGGTEERVEAVHVLCGGTQRVIEDGKATPRLAFHIHSERVT